MVSPCVWVLNEDALKEDPMLYYTVIFFVVAIVAALLGFTGVAAGAESIAKILFVIFLILFIASLLMQTFRGSRT